jgi:hypothetical protein
MSDPMPWQIFSLTRKVCRAENRNNKATIRQAIGWVTLLNLTAILAYLKCEVEQGDHDSKATDEVSEISEVFEHETLRLITDRHSAASNGADRFRPCHRSMPPNGDQGQFNRAIAGPSE